MWTGQIGCNFVSQMLWNANCKQYTCVCVYINLFFVLFWHLELEWSLELSFFPIQSCYSSWCLHLKYISCIFSFCCTNMVVLEKSRRASACSSPTAVRQKETTKAAWTIQHCGGSETFESHKQQPKWSIFRQHAAEMIDSGFLTSVVFLMLT